MKKEVRVVVAIILLVCCNAQTDSQSGGPPPYLYFAGGSSSYPYEAVDADNFRYPVGCKPENCSYAAKWSYDSESDSVSFTVSANVERGCSAGIGFKDQKYSTHEDVVSGYLKKDRYHFLLDDRHTEYLNGNKTIVDKQQDAVLISHSYHSGTLVYKFDRKRFTGDIYDKSLKKCVYFKFTWRETISSAKKIFFSKNKVCIGPMPAADPCKKMYCKVNSHCVHNGYNAKCICNSGYKMVEGHCKSPYGKDPCLHKYCKQHEYCVKLDGKAKCKCKPGHECESKMQVDDTNKWQG